MEYPKQKKTNWWLILLFIPLLVGCNPITEVLYEIGIIIGDQLINTAVGSTIEIVLDKVVGYIFPYVEPYPEDPLRGVYTKDLEFKKETPDCKYSQILKRPEMYRKSIQSKWELAPERRKEVYDILDKSCK